MSDKKLEFSLINLQKLIPISKRDEVLKWIKTRHEEAMAAELYGRKEAIIIETDSLIVTSDQLLEHIDCENGSISRECARLIVDIVNGGALPEDVIEPNRTVDENFLRYAYSA